MPQQQCRMAATEVDKFSLTAFSSQSVCLSCHFVLQIMSETNSFSSSGSSFRYFFALFLFFSRKSLVFVVENCMFPYHRSFQFLCIIAHFACFFSLFSARTKWEKIAEFATQTFDFVSVVAFDVLILTKKSKQFIKSKILLKIKSSVSVELPTMSWNMFVARFFLCCSSCCRCHHFFFFVAFDVVLSALFIVGYALDHSRCIVLFRFWCQLFVESFQYIFCFSFSLCFFRSGLSRAREIRDRRHASPCYLFKRFFFFHSRRSLFLSVSLFQARVGQTVFFMASHFCCVATFALLSLVYLQLIFVGFLCSVDVIDDTVVAVAEILYCSLLLFVVVVCFIFSVLRFVFCFRWIMK